MTNKDRTTIDRLLLFIPFAWRAKTERTPVAQQMSTGPSPDGIWAYQGARYPDEFYRFRDVLVESGWLDLEYDSDLGHGYMERPERVKESSFEVARSLLTYCDRGERFSEGFWGEALDSGFVFKVLMRLGEIRLRRSTATA